MPLILNLNLKQAEAERLLRSADRAAWARDGFRHRAALLVLLSGDRRAAEHLLRVRGATDSLSTACAMLLRLCKGVGVAGARLQETRRVGVYMLSMCLCLCHPRFMLQSDLHWRI